ncbi:MAG: ABC transporter permease subunit [Bacteriovoracales bacterium]|nr:ABC transporter permease subunit [Bacteriovoracales bacterium]
MAEPNHPPFWRDLRFRKVAFQVLVLGLLLVLGGILFSNAKTALENQNVASGFGFLKQEAAFEISDAPISYSAESSFGRALVVGLINTLVVALLGNILAVFWGTFLGIAQLSSNWLLAKLAKTYVTVFRNLPLVLLLFFWYVLVTEIFPSVREAIELLPHTYLSQRGLAVPVPKGHPSHPYILAVFFLGLAFSWLSYRWLKRRQEKTGKSFSLLTLFGGCMVLPPLLTWCLAGAPLELDVPALEGFGFEGGFIFTPEFGALLLGLVLYTGAFIAEIVRSGIQSVNKGQWEAATSLGMGSGKTLRLVILPQALRVIIPPLTGQILNLTKNSSLAVAIGYSDFVNVANTTMNQTGQAIECIALIMAVYLFFSLLTSLFMNWYNHATRLVTR